MILRTAIGLSLLLVLIPSDRVNTAEPLSFQSLKTRLAAKPTGEDADRLANDIRAWFGKDRRAGPP